MMKLYFIENVEASYKEVIAAAKSINPNVVVTVNEGFHGYETQDKAAAEEIAERFAGKVKVITADVKDLMK
jgi:tRNA(Ile)-lysidine synthase TilS/MesJ